MLEEAESGGREGDGWMTDDTDQARSEIILYQTEDGERASSVASRAKPSG
jgi:hypothetical protein